MWTYERKLQYPVKITRPNPAMAKFIMSQYGGPDGEIAASMRYLSQRYSMDNRKVAGLLTDIGISVSKLHISKTHNIKHTTKRYRAEHLFGILPCCFNLLVVEWQEHKLVYLHQFHQSEFLPFQFHPIQSSYLL